MGDVGAALVALAVVAAAVALRWRHTRTRSWSVDLSIRSDRRSDDGPDRRPHPPDG